MRTVGRERRRKRRGEEICHSTHGSTHSQFLVSYYRVTTYLRQKKTCIHLKSKYSHFHDAVPNLVSRCAFCWQFEVVAVVMRHGREQSEQERAHSVLVQAIHTDTPANAVQELMSLMC